MNAVRKRSADGKQARSLARKVLAPAVPTWRQEQRVRVFFERNGRLVSDPREADRIVVMRGGKLAVTIALREFEAKAQPFLVYLSHLLDEQANIAEWTLPFTEHELEVDGKRRVGTQLGAIKSTKPQRANLEKLMRTCIAKGEDATTHFATWATQYSYTVRHMRNIWNAVRAEAEK